MNVNQRIGNRRQHTLQPAEQSACCRRERRARALGSKHTCIYPVLLLLASAGFSQTLDKPGLRYEHRKTDAPHSIHILEVDPSRWRIEAERALNDGVGRETVSSMAERRAAEAAVNAGFFRIGGRYDGEPEGILRIAGRWFSDSAVARAAVGWRQGGLERLIGRLVVTWTLESAGSRFPIDGINRPRAPDEAILFNWAFHRSTITDPGGIEVQIAGGRVVAVARTGDSAIPVEGFVYSVGPQCRTSIDKLKPGKGIRVVYRLSASPESSSTEEKRWGGMDFIIGGIGLLLRDGRSLPLAPEEQMRPGFAEERHPRTAVGFRRDGFWVFVVVDGRQPQLSVGMSLAELAALMLGLGCTDAINLDGGGSSTLYHGKKIMNSPSDGRERTVSDAILVLPR